MSDEAITLLALGAGIGLLAGPAFVRWSPDIRALPLFLPLGALVTGIFLVQYFQGIPMHDGKRGVAGLAFVGPLLVAAGIAGLVAKAYLRRPSPKKPPAE